MFKQYTIALAVAALTGGCSALGIDHGSSERQASSSSSSSGASSQVSLASSTVEQIQRTLNEKGYDAGPVDGNWGPQTQTALKKFQQAQGIQASGKPDKQTLAALGVSENGSSATGGSAGSQQEQQGAAGGSSGASGSQGSSGTKQEQNQ